MKILSFFENREQIYNSFKFVINFEENNGESESVYICSPEIHEYICNMNYTLFSSAISIITKQKSQLTELPIYSIYKLDYETKKLEFFINMPTEYNNVNHNRIDTEPKDLTLTIISPKTFLKYYYYHSKNRYIFFPLVFMSSEKESGHQTFIAFDNFKKQVYLIDPNGFSYYFDSFLKTIQQDENESERLVESLIQGYIHEINKLGIDFKFISRKIWNKNKLVTNRYFKTPEISRGHCVICVLMLMHLLSDTQHDPQEILLQFKNLTDDLLISLINDYTIGLHRIITRTK